MSEQISRHDLIRACALNTAEFFVGGARDCGHRTVEWEDACASDRQIQDSIVNAALLLRPLETGEEVGLFRRLFSFYVETGSPWLLWSAWPTPDLAPYDVQLAGSPPLMLRNSDSEQVIPGKELTITEVRSPAEMAAHVSTLIRAYPIHHTSEGDTVEPFGPGNIGGPCRFWNGYVGGACVAVSSVCVSHGVLVVTSVATLESARGRGYGAAMTDVAARCALALPVLLTSSEMGKSVYERLGFRTISEFTIWEPA